MFLSGLSKGSYDRQGSQRARGAFLILMVPDTDSKAPFKGLVRHVVMHQCGHFMMGSLIVRVQGTRYRVSLSGAYGGDGLTRDVPSPVYALGTPLPDELRKQWNKGDGHNSTGSEAPAMHAWAMTLIFPASTYGADRRK